MRVPVATLCAFVCIAGCGRPDDAIAHIEPVHAQVPESVLALATVDAALERTTAPPQMPRRRELDQLHLLFIGNSYTRFNQLPLLVKRIADSIPNGPRIAVSMVAHGGYRLTDHVRAGAAARAIVRRRPTHVILQDRSDAFLDAEEYRKGVDALRAHAASVGAEVLLYETWARAEGDLLYREAVVQSPAEMLSRARALCESVEGSFCVPVGRSFAVWTATHTERLIRKDRSHPTLVGSYLAALTFYEAIAETPVESPAYFPFQSDGCFQHGRAARCVDELREVAHQVVAEAFMARAALPETNREQTTTRRSD